MYNLVIGTSLYFVKVGKMTQKDIFFFWMLLGCSQDHLLRDYPQLLPHYSTTVSCSNSVVCKEFII